MGFDLLGKMLPMGFTDMIAPKWLVSFKFEQKLPPAGYMDSKTFEKNAIRKIKWFIIVSAVLVIVVPFSLLAVFPAHALLFKIIFVVLAFSLPFAIKRMVVTNSKKLKQMQDEESGQKHEQ